jgi:hypothetical protein
MKRSDLAKRFFIARLKMERAKKQGGGWQGLKFPSVRLGMI